LSVRALALALILALGACQQDPPAPGPTDPVAPQLSAEGYGPVRIGMTVAEAQTAFGAELHPGGALEPETCETYAPLPDAGHDGIRFMAQEGRITRISDHGTPNVRTAQGVGVGSTDAEIRAAYPNAIEAPAKYDPPPAHSLTVWTVPDESGLRFEVSAEGVVTTVHAGGESIQLVEGCS
jgi:hypothetical protein